MYGIRLEILRQLIGNIDFTVFVSISGKESFSTSALDEPENFNQSVHSLEKYGKSRILRNSFASDKIREFS